MAIISNPPSNGKERGSFKNREHRYSRYCIALQKEAARLGRTVFLIVIDYINAHETREELTELILDADPLALFVFVDVPGTEDGKHFPHIQGIIAPSGDRYHQLWPAKDKRNEDAALFLHEGDGVSWWMKKPNPKKGGLQGWINYCANKDNLGRFRAEVFTDHLTLKRAALDIMPFDPKSQGKARVSGRSLARTHGHAMSTPKPDLLQPSAPPPHAGHQRAGVVVPDALHDGAGRSVIATTSEVIDWSTGEVLDTAISSTAAVIVLPSPCRRPVQPDLFGPLSHWTALEQPAAGHLSPDLREAVEYILRGYGMTHADLARMIDLSRSQTTNVLRGRFGTTESHAARLVRFVKEGLADLAAA